MDALKRRYVPNALGHVVGCCAPGFSVDLLAVGESHLDGKRLLGCKHKRDEREEGKWRRERGQRRRSGQTERKREARYI